MLTVDYTPVQNLDCTPLHSGGPIPVHPVDYTPVNSVDCTHVHAVCRKNVNCALYTYELCRLYTCTL